MHLHAGENLDRKSLEISRLHRKSACVIDPRRARTIGSARWRAVQQTGHVPNGAMNFTRDRRSTLLIVTVAFGSRRGIEQRAGKIENVPPHLFVGARFDEHAELGTLLDVNLADRDAARAGLQHR